MAVPMLALATVALFALTRAEDRTALEWKLVGTEGASVIVQPVARSSGCQEFGGEATRADVTSEIAVRVWVDRTDCPEDGILIGKSIAPLALLVEGPGQQTGALALPPSVPVEAPISISPVPGVERLPLDVACKLASMHGLKPRIAGSSGRDAYVVRQSPAGGSPRKLGAELTMWTETDPALKNRAAADCG